MSWGYKITFLYLGFVLMMVTMVVLCIKQKDIFLVTENYYQDEIGYQEKINRMNNANKLSEKALVYTSKNADSLFVKLGKSGLGSTGKITFYRPSNSKLDFSIPISLDQNGTQSVYIKNNVKGQWTIKLDWKKGQTPYYAEHKIQI